MARFESAAPPATSERVHTPKQSLPSGPCNHRDPAFGTPCGCHQFWDNNNVDVYLGSTEHQSSKRSTWCVCGHHACMHARESRPLAERLERLAADTRSRVHRTCDASCQSRTGSQCNVNVGVPSIRDELSPMERDQPIHSVRPKTSPADLNQLMLPQAVSQFSRAGLDHEARDSPSQSSSSGLPRIPSVCFMSHDRHPATDREARNYASPSRQTMAGLGLGLGMTFGNMGNSLDRRPSVTSTIPDDINLARSPSRPYSEPAIPSIQANSVTLGHEHVNSPGLGQLDQILQFNRNLLHLTTAGDTIPNTYNPEDFIQSATEVATPSNANTPDLGLVDEAVQESRALIDTLHHLASNQQGNSPESRPNSTTSAPAPQLLLTNSPAPAYEQLQQAFRTASPKTVHQLMTYLKPLHNVLISIPNVANALRELSDRMDLLENNSFNHVQPEDYQRQFEMMDGRQLELEHRMDDHDRLHQTIDADHSTSSFPRRRLANITESFGSNHSGHSTTSSALIVAAIDRNEIETELEGIKDRLDMLEAAALPTSVDPWEVEVVLLPWGRELRGIWFSPGQPMHDNTKAITQDSEDWTQVRGLKSDQVSDRVTDSSPLPNERLSHRSSMPFSDTESGWSSQAICDWATGSTDEWLSPKATGGTNQIYQRLKSRGFVRDVTLRNASAREIQTTLANAFSDMMEHLRCTDEDEDSIMHLYPALRASFIPLRKVHKDSRLRFLTPSEMASSALWTAQFLASGIMMRASGGKKRLYVTQREAYMQQSDQMGSPWTWHDLRLLPRFQVDPDSEMEGNAEKCQPQVAEADAREECWAFNPLYDAPPASVESSFGSHHSAQLSMRPSDRQWRRSITPSSILKNRQPQPISPLSEAHPLRPSQGRLRTVSAPQIEQVHQSSAKRRFNASPVKPSSAPHVTSRTPSVSVARLKRRRVAPSSSPRPDANVHANVHDTGVPIWANTPRRSHEPQSPFFSSHPELPRTNSDVASRVGKGTPFAYATPHSGPFLLGGGNGGGGDTEPDSDDYQDDGEQSWRGVEDDDAEAGAEDEDEEPSFSGDESGFGTEDDGGVRDAEDSNDDAGDGDDEHGFGFGVQRRANSEADDDDDDDVYDTLLGVLQSR